MIYTVHCTANYSQNSLVIMVDSDNDIYPWWLPLWPGFDAVVHTNHSTYGKVPNAAIGWGSTVAPLRWVQNERSQNGGLTIPKGQSVIWELLIWEPYFGGRSPEQRETAHQSTCILILNYRLVALQGIPFPVYWNRWTPEMKNDACH